jgi:hypothetical protein
VRLSCNSAQLEAISYVKASAGLVVFEGLTSEFLEHPARKIVKRPSTNSCLTTDSLE